MAKQTRQITIEQAIAFVTSRSAAAFTGDVAYRQRPRPDSIATIFDALKRELIRATGSVDADPERPILAGEWANYVLEVESRRQFGAMRAGGGPHWYIRIRSTRCFQASALKDHSCRSNSFVHNALSPTGVSPGFHRVISGVRMIEREVRRLRVRRPPNRTAKSKLVETINGLAEAARQNGQQLTKQKLVNELNRKLGCSFTTRSRPFCAALKSSEWSGARGRPPSPRSDYSKKLGVASKKNDA
ncbi:MAG TPA: hypothetical protein VFA57_12210 [Pseudolabrys sp.]|nr:hypothetical protein [Pseudolabrys sp.]